MPRFAALQVAAGVPTVPVADQEPEAARPLTEVPQQVAGLLHVMPSSYPRFQDRILFPQVESIAEAFAMGRPGPQRGL
jgi:hypothetical protein